MDYVIAPDAKTLWLGRQGENLARTLVFNLSDWIEAFGQGTAAIIVRRSGGDGLYPATVTADGGTVRWTIRAADVAQPGYGIAELRYLVGDVVVKSRVYVTQTDDGLGDAGDAPDPEQSWVDEVLEAAADVEAAVGAAHEDAAVAAASAAAAIQSQDAAAAAASGAEAAASHYPYVDATTKRWMVWDTSTGAYTDTGVVAEGQDGHGLVVLGIYATLAALQSAHPTARQGDVYAVGTAESNVIYLWDGSAWVSLGVLMGPRGDPGPAGPNTVTAETTTTLTGVLTGAGGAVGVKPVDAAPAANSGNLVTSGGVAAAIAAAGRGVNLLDNWYFVGGGSQQGGGQFPINQRGQTGYDGDYGIDRWYADSYVTAALVGDGISLSRATGHSENYRGIYQTTERIFTAGQQLTLSMLCTGSNDGQARFTITQNGTAIYERYPNITAGEMGLGTGTFTVPGDGPITVGLRLGDVTTLKIHAAKLELGDRQTLARQESGAWVLNDPAPNFAQELAKCQRYLLVCRYPNYRIVANGYAVEATSFRGIIPTPVTMRAAPTITKTVSALYLIGGAQEIDIASATITDVRTPEPGCIPFDIRGLSGLTKNRTYSLLAYNGSIILSAEL